MSDFPAAFTEAEIKQGCARSTALEPARRLVMATLAKGSDDLLRAFASHPDSARELAGIADDVVEHTRAELELLEVARARIGAIVERIKGTTTTDQERKQ